MPAVSKIYEFGDFRLDTAKETLRRGDSNIAITKKMFDTLVVLVENADRLVEKQELMQTVWHDRFVEESNLTFNIKMLRKALGDSASHPTYIETVPRRGYRFIAEVRTTSPAVASSTHPPINLSAETTVSSNAIRRVSLSRSYIAVIVAVILVSSLAFASLLWQKGLSKSRAVLFPSGFRSVKISETGKVHHAVLSPDGRYIAYTNVSNGKHALWLRHLETSYNTPILPVSDDIYYGLAFSRDSNSLYFVRTPDLGNGSSMMYRVPVTGGVPAKVVESVQGWISVSPDDKFISYVRIQAGTPEMHHLFIADADGGNERELKTAEPSNCFWASAFSPDGKSLAVVYGNSATASRQVGIVEIDIATGEQREIMKDKFFHIKDVEWMPDQRSLLFSADEHIGDTIRLWQLDYETGRASVITSDTTNYSNITINDDASLVLTTTLLPDFHLYVQDSDHPGELRKLSQARDRFAFSRQNKIVYASDAAGNEDIWVMDEDGSNQRQLTTDSGLDFFPIVSSDGRRVYFTSNRTGESQVWQMNIDGSNPAQITHNDGGFARFETLDGQALYYQSAMTDRLMRVDLHSGEETAFPGETGFFQSFSPDGRRLAYLIREPKSPEDPKIRIVEVETGEVMKTFSIPADRGFVNFLRWKTNDVLGYALNARAGNDTVWTQDINESSPRLLLTLDDDGFLDLEFSQDGKSVGVIRGTWRHDALLLSASK